MLILTHGTNISNTQVFTSIDESIQVKPNLEDFWKVESIGIYDNPCDSDDEIAMKKFTDTLMFKDNRYHVTWPWIGDSQHIQSNRQLAVGRLKSLIGRLHSKPDIMKKYSSVIDEQLKNNIIEKIDENQNDGIRHYIPHHPVIKPDRSTTKLRVVYDASAKVKPDSKSLTECLYIGPVLLQDLCGILLRFRLNRIVIVSDIEKAFLQICLQPSERDVTRFLWVKDTNRPLSIPSNLQEYRFCRVPFGVISSPFLLCATVNHHLDKYDSDVARQIKRDIYMDNVITGVNSVQDGINMYTTAKQIFSEASMNLREWTSNDEEVMSHIPEKDRNSKDCLKVLGLSWNRRKDLISVKCIKIISVNDFTKRQVLHELAMVFDPLGLFSPITLKGKLLLQSLWSKHLAWDEKLCKEDTQIWCAIREDLIRVSSVTLPRCVVNMDKEADTHLLCFCDASEKAYATVIYIVQRSENICSSQLIFSKSRLSPTTSTSIPRLELLAVLIGVRCLSFVKKQLCIPVKRCVIHSDSQCTLKWIYSEKKLPVFVQNRVNEIRKHSDMTFSYVKSIENPADLASRGCDLRDITQNELWWQGPQWLMREEKEWPVDQVTEEYLTDHVTQSENRENVQCELSVSDCKLIRKNTECFPKKSPLDIDIERFSSGKKLLRVTATAMKFIDQVKGKVCPPLIGCVEIEKAEKMWIEHVQANSFEEIFTAINAKKRHNIVYQLGLYIDENNIIRCKGRLENSSLSEGARYPILLPKDDKFSPLLIDHIHQKCQHTGVSQTLSLLRQRFWIPKGRATVRKVLSKCQVCRRFEGGAYGMPPFAPLPKNRVSETPPFSCTGIDYMGPLYIKEEDQQKKVWICLYTCMVIRAVHLELVHDMSTEAFLNSLRRFIACRGKPNEIECDNAMQFKLASETIEMVWGEIVKHEDIQSYCASENIKWHFIVELAPLMGGFYERMVGLIKRSMRKAIGRNLLDRNKFLTVMKEAEAVVNSRPLVYVGDDINSTIAITPGHFICLNPKMGIPDSEDQEIDPEFKLKLSSADKLLRIWEKGQKLLDKFWLIWREQYLTSLRERCQKQQRRAQQNSDLRANVGDIVLIKDAMPRGSWKFGRIIDLIQSKDGLYRSAKVRTSSGYILGRPLCLLYPIETSSKEESKCTEKAYGPSPFTSEKSLIKPTNRGTARKAAMRTKLCLKDLLTN